MKKANRSARAKTFRLRAMIIAVATIALALTYVMTAHMEVQDTGQYTFATTTTASLTDMSSGTSTLVGPNADDVASAVTAIGFDFYFQGTRFDQFSANSNGLIRLGGTAVQTGSPYKPLAQAGLSLITPYGADQRTHLNGKVHTKVTGSAPNRVLVVEWKNMQSGFSSGAAADLTYQARLYETTGVIEFVYGSMTMGAAGAADPNSKDPNIGFSSGTAAGTIGTVTAAQSGAPAPSYNGATTTAVANTYIAGTITVLNSAADGSRRNFTFTPNTPTPPTDNGTTGITKSAMTLNWNDLAANELGYVIYRSTDNVNFTFVTQLAAGSTTSTQSGLSSNTTYYWKVYAVTEGGLSSALSITQPTLAGTVVANTKSVGPTGTYLSLTAAISDITTNGLTGAGAVTLELQSTYLSTVETFPLAITNIAGPSNPIIIRPATGASGLTITSTAAQTFNINGGANITIDGRAGGVGATKDLTIDNTSTTGTAIQFINDAVNDTVQYTIVKGAATSATNGVVVFSTASGLVTGNDNITLDFCDLRDSTTTPTNIIFSSGTTTDNRLGNSNVTISNSNLFNFFNSGATVANGVNLSSGTTDWTINNCNFYQTVARAPIAGGGFIAITISNIPGSNFTVSNNFIGGSAPGAGGTAWTQTAATTHTFIGIRLSVGGRLSSVQGNVIQNISISTSSTSTINAGISAVTGSFNIGTTAPNIIGSTASPTSISWIGAGAAAQLTGILAGTGTVGSAAISTNTIAGIAVSGAGTTVLRAINTQGSTAAYTISGNTIGNSTGTISNSTNLVTTGILSSAAGTTTVSNNTISFMSATAAGTATGIVGVNTSSGINTITGNTIRNLSTNSTATGTTTTAAAIGITQNSVTAIVATTAHTVSQNTIHTITNAGGAAVTVINGIHFAATTTTGTGANVIARNLVHSLVNTSTSASAIVNGIHASAGFSTFQNNMIRLGIDSAGADITTGTIVSGIRDATANTTSTNGFYHNSVFIGGSGVSAGAAATQGYIRTATGITDFRNNILVNNRANGAATGKHYIISINATTTFTSNFNDFFDNGGTGQVFGLVAAADQASFAVWKGTTTQDGNSVFGDPQFINPNGTSFAPNAVVDLHIHPTNPTVIEAAGTLIAAVTDDFDGQTRSGLTPVDIGADAGNFTALDLAPPVISYTPLTNLTSTANRSFTGVTVVDGSGVNGAAGTRPRVYYKKASDVNNTFNDNTSATVGWKFAEANGSTSPFDFTIDYSRLFGGTVTTGDVIQYFVVAQDLAPIPNVGINIGVFNTTPASVALTASAFPITGTIRSYTLSASLTGNKTVCSAGFPTCDYGSLTNTGGIFEAINNGVVTGDLNILITSDLAGETGAVALNQTSEEFVATIHNITIKPSGAARSITGTGVNLIKLNGANRVTIDGSLAGGTDRSLTIENTNATTPNVVVFGSVGATPITDDTLKNCIVRNGVNTSSAVIISDAGTIGNAGVFSNITIQNNDIQKAFVGVFATGGTIPQNGSNLIYTQNTVNTSGANAIRGVGLYMQGVNGATVSDNVIGNFNATNDENDVGIWLATGTINATVSGNTISNLNYTGTGAFSPIGINVTPTIASSGDVIRQNTISNMTSGGSSSTSLVMGISVTGASGGVTIEKNNVQNIGDTNPATWPAVGINLNGGNNIVVRNNFVARIYNDQTAGTGGFSTTFGVSGIRLNAGTGHQVYNNTVHMFGAMSGSVSSNLLSALAVASTGVTGCDIRNNILSNQMTGGNTTGGNTRFAAINLPSGGTSGMALTLNNNAYFEGTDPNDKMAVVGQAVASGDFAAANFNPGAVTPSTNFRSYSSTLGAVTNDDSSQVLTTTPPFVSNTDLHLTVPNTLLGAGAAIGSVINDYDMDPRPASGPDIGADEIVQAAGGTFPSGTFYNAILGGGDTLGGNATITNSLTLTGMSNTGASTVTLDCGATISGASSTNYVIGNMQKNYCAPTAFTYPVGTANSYSPMTATITGGTFPPATPPSLKVSATQTAQPVLNSAKSLQRYWTLIEGGDLTANLTFTYATDAIDVPVTSNEAIYKVIKVEGGTASNLNPPQATVDALNNMFTVTGVSSFSDWTVGEPLAPTNTTANIGGHVLTNTGQPIAGVTINLLDTSTSQTFTTITDGNGLYHFDSRLTGRDYVISPTRFGYQFSPQNLAFSLTGDRANDDFIAAVDTTQRRAVDDFDGDGKTDLSVWRPSSGTWYILQSSTGVMRADQWGTTGDRIVPADYDGDGKTDLAVFRPSNGTWYIYQSTTNSLRGVQWGLGTDVAMPADYDGDGRADLAVFRPSNGTWYILQSGNGQMLGINWGTAGDRPVAADYDGDGRADVAVWRPSNATFYIINSSNNQNRFEHWGVEADQVVVGDYDADGKADLAVFRANNTTWYVKLSTDGSITSQSHGTAQDRLVPGDFDGDGKTDRAVWQTADGNWLILRSTTNVSSGQKWGANGDVPAPSAYIQ